MWSCASLPIDVAGPIKLCRSWTPLLKFSMVSARHAGSCGAPWDPIIGSCHKQWFSDNTGICTPTDRLKLLKHCSYHIRSEIDDNWHTSDSTESPQLTSELVSTDAISVDTLRRKFAFCKLSAYKLVEDDSAFIFLSQNLRVLVNKLFDVKSLICFFTV